MSLSSRLSTVAIASTVCLILALAAPLARAQNVFVLPGDSGHSLYDPSMAVFNGHAVVAFTNTADSNNCLMGVQNSPDGVTFTTSTFTCMDPANPGINIGQPSLAVNPSTGTFYLATTVFSFSNGPTLYVATSTNNGVNFGPPVVVATGAPSKIFSVPQVAIDTSSTPSNGFLYVGATNSALDGSTSDTRVWKSADGGSTWIPAAGTTVGPNPLGSFDFKVDPVGAPYVAGVGSTGAIDLSKSSDQGSTFTQITPTFNGAAGPAGVLALSLSRTPLLFPFLTNASGFDTGLAISNTTTDPFSADVSFAHSIDGGLTYGPFQRLNPNPTGLKEIYPNLGFTPDGTHAWAIWYDASLDLTHANSNVFITFGTPDANRNFTFTAPFSVSDTAAPVVPASRPSGYFGVRNADTALDGAFVAAAWSDNRNGFASIVFGKVPIPVAICPTVTITPDTLRSGTVGKTFSLTQFIVVDPSTYSLTGNNFSLGGTGLVFLPSGPSSLNVFGTPLRAGSIEFTVTAAPPPELASCPVVSKAYTINIAPAISTPTITASSLTAPFGTEVDVTVNVPGVGGVNPTGGTINLLNGSAIIATAPFVSGGVTFKVTTLPVGQINLTGQFVSADPNFLPATSAPLVVTIVPQDVTAQISTTESGLLYSRVTKTVYGTFTFKNISRSSIDPPLNVVFTSLPSGVTLVNATGTYNNKPYIKLPSGIAVGQTINFRVGFTDVGGLEIIPPPVDYRGDLAVGK